MQIVRTREAISRAHQAGWQIGVHAQGDWAIGMTLDALAAASAAHPRRDPRHRIEHAGYPTAEQIARMAGLGIVTVNQPTYLHDSGDEFLLRLGERASRLLPLREELDRGVTVVLSSDSDVSSFRPLGTIANAVRRTTANGSAIGTDLAAGHRPPAARHRLTGWPRRSSTLPGASTATTQLTAPTRPHSAPEAPAAASRIK
jgi:predicted amidohydrolase YtcJ